MDHSLLLQRLRGDGLTLAGHSPSDTHLINFYSINTHSLPGEESGAGLHQTVSLNMSFCFFSFLFPKMEIAFLPPLCLQYQHTGMSLENNGAVDVSSRCISICTSIPLVLLLD